ncbi:hypothetical protein ACJX0J_008300, partial [Zea mays]
MALESPHIKKNMYVVSGWNEDEPLHPLMSGLVLFNKGWLVAPQHLDSIGENYVFLVVLSILATTIPSWTFRSMASLQIIFGCRMTETVTSELFFIFYHLYLLEIPPDTNISREQHSGALMENATQNFPQ